MPCQVAYVSDGAQLTAVASDATRDAIRSGELRLTGCAFLPNDGQGTLHQLGRIRKYVERGFRLPAGPLAAAPEALRDGSPSTALRKLNYVLLELLGGRLHWEPVTPPRSATPACRPHPLMLRFAMTDRGNWHLAAPRSSAAAWQSASAARECVAPAASGAGCDGVDNWHRSLREQRAVWTAEEPRPAHCSSVEQRRKRQSVRTRRPYERTRCTREAATEPLASPSEVPVEAPARAPVRVTKEAETLGPPPSASAQQLASAARECAAPVAALPRHLCSHAESLAVWTFVRKLKKEVERTKQDARARVPQYHGWRVLGQLRRSGKGIERFDMYVLAPEVLPDMPLHALRPTNQAVRSFRGLCSLLTQRSATTASGGVVAAGAARSSGRCPMCCTEITRHRPLREEELGCRPIRVCGEDEEPMDMGQVAGEDSPL